MADEHLTVGHVDAQAWGSLYRQLKRGSAQPVLDYLAGGGDPNLRIRLRGPTLLHAAAFRDRLAVVEELIRCGADVDARSEPDQFTPLATAAHKAHLGCLRRLIAAGASVECKPLGLSLLDSLQYAQVKSEKVRQILLAAAGRSPRPS